MMDLRFATVWLLAACATHHEPENAPVSASTESSQRPTAGVDDAALAQLLADHWDGLMERAPVWATVLGDRRFDDRIGDNSKAGILEYRAWRDGLIARADALPAAALTPRDRVTRALFVEELARDRDTDACAFEEWNVSARDNPMVEWNRLPEDHPVKTVADGRNLLARYRAIPTYIDNELALLREGLANGRVATRESVRRTLQQLDAALAEPMDEWPLLDPLKDAHSDWSPADREQLASDLRAVVKDDIAHAYARYRDALHDELLPKARGEDRAGMVWLPDGEACYAATARQHTTTDRTAEQIQALGLQEIARIDGEIAALGEELFGTRDLAAILERLRTDESLYFKTSAEVQAAAEDALAEAKAKIPGWFGILPRADCTVKPVPDYEAPFTTIAYYQQPAPDVGRPGQYNINLYAPTTRPRFEARVLAYHESIPGHHLQIAIAQERSELPAFRRHGGFTAFVEGWALYTEALADEMGLYPTPLDEMGRLSFDAWRAARLVVDTGIHAKGWTREQAERYMLAHTALTPENITNEVDRYINTPGQALAYKIGQLEILALRRDAESKLGAAFDPKAFHDAVLTEGAVSLSVLRDQVAAWTASGGGRAAASP
jgi:uncharacterized protein (DUF885 family)